MTVRLPRPRIGLEADAGSSLQERTGGWRAERPVYVSLTPPCQQACPAGLEVRDWLYLAQEAPARPDRWRAAWQALTRSNPLPAVTGLVCYRRCEGACNRQSIDGAVAIGQVERFIGLEALRQGWQFDPPAAPTGRSALVIGAGPAGLSAAHCLRRAGHAVTVHESLARPGGMMRLGIPPSRLPRWALDAEIARLEASGVDLAVGRTTRLNARLWADYDAVVWCVGAAAALALAAEAVLWRQPIHTARGRPAERTVTLAIAQGRGAAEAVNAFWAGTVPDEPAEAPIATLGRLNTWYYTRSAARPAAPAETGPQAGAKARRCLVCGACLECDNCYALCPDDAVIKLGRGRGYQIDLDYCKGCGLCARECPSGAMTMVLEPGPPSPARTPAPASHPSPKGPAK